MNDGSNPPEREQTGVIAALDRGFGAIAGWSFDHRWVVVAFSLALFAYLAVSQLWKRFAS